MFSVETPPNWEVDSESAKVHGIDAVSFPVGSSWRGPVTIYPRVWQKGEDLSLAQVMDEDLRQYTQSNPSIQVADAAPIGISISATAKVRYFSSSKPALHEAVAYVDQNRTVILLVLRTASEAEFKEVLPTFESFVRSYRPLTHLRGSAA